MTEPTLSEKAPFVCTHCGKCCLTIPCIFAQVKYLITSKSGTTCPDLVKRDDGTYSCSLIERDAEAREVLLSGDCDAPDKVALKKQFSVKEIVLEYFPNATDEVISDILWNYTSYPNFWNIPEDGWTSTQCLRKQLSKLKNKVGAKNV